MVNLIEEVKKSNPELKIGKATQIALNQVVGAFAIVVFDKDSPNELVVAKLGSPLAIGLKGKDFFVGSDPSPFIKETNRCLYLNDYELAILSRKKGLTLRDFRTNRVKDQKIEKLKLQIEQVEKGGFKHFMLKEIFEQPKCINDSLRGRIFSNPGKIRISVSYTHLTLPTRIFV